MPELELKDVFNKHIATIEQKFAAQGATVAEVQAGLLALEQKLDRGYGNGGKDVAPPSWGNQFIEQKADEIGAMSSERRPVSMEIKATITTSNADAAGSAGSLIVPQRDQLVMLPKRRLTIRNLLNVVQASSGTAEYPQQVSHATNAAPVAEGAAKPESDLQFELKTVPMRVIAHWVKASRQVLDDSPQLANIIDVELRYGLALAEEAQLLKGSGTGQNLLGMNLQASAYDPAFAIASETMIDRLGLAILQVALTDNQPDGIILHPSDWWKMRLLKDADGNYIFGAPGADVTPTLFGLPIVPTQAQTADEFTVGAFAAQTLYDRWVARVETGFVNDDFTKNLVTILGEERIGFAAKRPDALVHGNFTDEP